MILKHCTKCGQLMDGPSDIRKILCFECRTPERRLPRIPEDEIEDVFDLGSVFDPPADPPPAELIPTD